MATFITNMRIPGEQLTMTQQTQKQQLWLPKLITAGSATDLIEAVRQHMLSSGNLNPPTYLSETAAVINELVTVSMKHENKITYTLEEGEDNAGTT